MTDTWLPLELTLKDLADSKKHEFANQHANYWERYVSLVSTLRLHVYSNINAGLACLSRSPGLYTEHGADHFDEVVKYAGLLIGNTFNNPKESLTPYELYVLLCAIRIHDAGNIDGREEHEKRATNILMKYGGQIALDGSAEVELIGAIAQAHGGHTIDGDKDTIGVNLPEVTTNGSVDIRPQMVAALVRFSDEICEHSNRAALHHIAHDTLPEKNKLFHFYARSIVGARPDRENKAYKLKFNIDTSILTGEYLTPTDSRKYFIDDVWDRIDKLNHERVYCNRFLPPAMQTDRIEIEMDFKKVAHAGSQPIGNLCFKHKLTIRDKGYPVGRNAWKNDVSGLDGPTLAKKDW